MVMLHLRAYTLIFLWIFSQCMLISSNEIVCELAAFLENMNGSNPLKIDSGKIKGKIESCDDENEQKCKQMAELEASVGTTGGNFSLPLDDNEGYTVGDILCDKADLIEENIRNKIVRIYYRFCGSEWKKSDFKMPEPLCCEDGLYVPCKNFYHDDSL